MTTSSVSGYSDIISHYNDMLQNFWPSSAI